MLGLPTKALHGGAVVGLRCLFRHNIGPAGGFRRARVFRAYQAPAGDLDVAARQFRIGVRLIEPGLTGPLYVGRRAGSRQAKLAVGAGHKF